MEHNGGNQNMPPPSLCRSGCGFYGSESFEGMCSKCYKDQIKRKQQNPSPSPVTGRNSPSVSSLVESSSAASFATTSTSAVTTPTTPSVETAMPTVPTPSNQSQKSKTEEEQSEPEGATGGADTSTCTDSDSSDLSDKKPKKNRCHTCKKKVGLTGFSCRCGGLFCSVHRYSDKHECTFNYKELGQTQIRKQNPVVISSKIQKI